MNIFYGVMLVLFMLTLIFLGPEWAVRFVRKPKRFKKLIYIPSEAQAEALAGRRRSNRP